MRRAAAAVALSLLLAAAAAPSQAGSRHPYRAESPLGEISIARIGLDQPIAQGGWDLYTAPWPRSLNRGPAHYPNTPMPWQAGTAALAGHRTTWTHPFLHLNDLRRGDRIVWRTPYNGTFVYSVRRMKIVAPTYTAILRAPRRGHRLLLTACHPPHLATYRIAVWAVLVSWRH